MAWIGLVVWILLVLAYWALASSQKGFARQHAVARAGTPTRFLELVRDVGGASAARSGVWLDLGFIATLTVPSGIFLARSDHPALVGFAVLAAAVDLVEDLLLLRALREPAAGGLRLLKGISTAKILAYAAIVPAVIVSL